MTQHFPTRQLRFFLTAPSPCPYLPGRYERKVFAHLPLADGPAVLTLLEMVTTALVARGLNPDTSSWDAWRNEDGRWTVQLAWTAGRSDNVAHFRFVPGVHGGTVTAELTGERLTPFELTRASYGDAA